MKKIVVLVLVLSMTTLANAGFKIYVNGSEPAGTVNLNPSETATISVYATTNGTGAFDMWLLMEKTPSTVPASMTGGSRLFGDNSASLFTRRTYLDTSTAANTDLTFLRGYYPNVSYAYHIIIASPLVMDPETEEMVPAPVDDMSVVGSISFNALVAGTETLRLISVPPTGGLGSDYDLQDINIIPEPMTVALLGLGGLFALRRRK